jgi:nucleoside-diphosphate-sugar epimerase
MSQHPSITLPPLAGADIVVFGGAGFIGRHLVGELLTQGAERVVVADVSPPGAPLPEGAYFETCDVRRPIELAASVSSPFVFNLAAVHRTPGHRDIEYHETNVAGARNVIDFCRAHGTSSLWFTSSIAVYGPSEEPRTEESPLEPASAYGASKIEAELVHREWATEADDRRLIIVRPAAVFGPGENGNFTRLASALARRRFLYPGRKDTVKACGHVDELIRTLMFMWSAADPTITYNFTYPSPPTIEEICRAFHEIGDLPLPLAVAPVRPLMLAANALKAVGLKAFDPVRVEKLFRSTNIQPRELLARHYPYETDLSSALVRWRDTHPTGQFV